VNLTSSSLTLALHSGQIVRVEYVDGEIMCGSPKPHSAPEYSH